MAITLNSQLSFENPVFAFGIGLILGAILGFQYLVLLALILVGYYYRKEIITLVEKSNGSSSWISTVRNQIGI